MERTFTELIALVEKEDQDAIEELYKRTFQKANYIAVRTLKTPMGENYADQIDDILQDSYIKALDKLNTLEDPERFQGWFDTIVINRCRDFLKKKKPEYLEDLNAENPDDGSVRSFEEELEDTAIEFRPDESIDYSETKRLVGEMVDRLPENQRLCVLMYYYEEMSVGSIAEALACSEGTVKSRLNYARKNLKEQVLELEKKGTKLYCVPFAPFLYWLFRQELLDFLGKGTGTAAAGAAAVSQAAAGESMSAAGTTSAAGSTASAAGTASSAGGAASAVGAGAAILTPKVLGISAAVVIAAAGGSAAVSGRLPEKLPFFSVFSRSDEAEDERNESEPQTETDEAEETDSEQDSETLAEDTAGEDAVTAEMNRKILAYSRSLIENDENLVGKDVSFGIFDANGDGVSEVYVNAIGSSNAESCALITYMTKAGNCEYTFLLDDYFGYIPETGQIIAAKYHMGIAVDVYELRDIGLQEMESFWYDIYDPSLGEVQPESDAENERKFGEYTERAVVPSSVQATPENLDRYFGEADDSIADGQEWNGGIAEEGSESGSMDGTSASDEAFEVDVNLAVEHIRQTYAYTNAHIGEYEKTSVNKAGWGEWVESNPEYHSTFYYHGDIQVKQVIEYGDYNIEVYDENPALVDNPLPTTEVNPEDMAEFVFATVNGSEYRIYIKSGRVIRFIGPDHVTHDYSRSLNLDEFNQSVGNTYDEIGGILSAAFPAWWTMYEGEG